jgi:serine protease Do
MRLYRSSLIYFALAASAVLGLGLTRAGAQPTMVPTILPPAADKSKDKPLPSAFSKPYPENLADLKDIEDHVKEVLAKVIPCTVGLRVGGASGSGVIVSEDGLILTAAHVSGQPGRDVTVIMPDGTTHRGKTLGGNETIDSGMAKIIDEGKWPFVEMGKSADMKKGDWCIVTGQPGGFRPGRSPVVRYGRIVDLNLTTPAAYIRTDNTLVGGDSGGPLFDMYGRVIGIHSRIGGNGPNSITQNIHVPVDTYRDTWERLVKAERWGSGIGGGGRGGRGGRGGPGGPGGQGGRGNQPVNPDEPEYGMTVRPHDAGCEITLVTPGSAAERAGLKIDDVIKKYDGKAVTTVDAFVEDLKKRKPDDEVTLEILRGTQTLTIKIKAARKAAPPAAPGGGGRGG